MEMQPCPHSSPAIHSRYSPSVDSSVPSLSPPLGLLLQDDITISHIAAGGMTCTAAYGTTTNVQGIKSCLGPKVAAPWDFTVVDGHLHISDMSLFEYMW